MDFLTANWRLVSIAVAVLLVVAINWKSIVAMIPAGSAVGTTTVKPGVPSRRQVLDYLDAAYAYFEAEKCKEGMEATKLAVTHAFHEHTGA